MYAQLGSKIIFNTVKAPESFGIEKEISYAEHALMEGKPTLQRTGDKLDKTSLVIRLHAQIEPPENTIRYFETAMKSGEILPFIMGTGESLGTFIITKIVPTREVDFPNGQMLSVVLDVELLEYSDPSIEITIKQQAIRNAYALSTNAPPVTDLPPYDGSIYAQTLKQIEASNAENNAILGIFGKIKAQVTLYRDNIDKVMQRALLAGDATNAVLRLINADPASDLYQKTRDLSLACFGVVSTIGDIMTISSDILNDIDAGNLAPVPNKINHLALYSNDLQTKNDTMTRSAVILTADKLVQ